MDSNGLTRFPPPKSPTSNRFLLGAYSHFPPPLSESPADAELTEDDIFAINFFEYNDHYHHPRSVVHHHQNNKKTNFLDSFGILAVLPESSAHSNFYHKASMPSSSSSRTIPSIPKPAQERVAFGKFNQYQSAPVNVPMLAKAMKKNRHFEEDEVGGEMVVPPHEMVGRGLSPILSCSVLEGAGRTLKGRDLRQVRNAVWRQTALSTSVSKKSS